MILRIPLQSLYNFHISLPTITQDCYNAFDSFHCCFSRDFLCDFLSNICFNLIDLWFHDLHNA